MSLSKLLAEQQWKAGIGFKPDHIVEQEQTEALDGAAFGAATWDTFRAIRHGTHSDEQVAAAAAAVAESWRAQGREIVPNRDTAEELAFAVSNRLSGGFGAGPYGGGGNPAGIPEDGDTVHTDGLSGDLHKHQKLFR